MKCLVLALIAAVVAPAASDYFPPPDSKGGWRSLTSASDAELLKKAGMDRAKLDEAFEFAKDTTQHGGLVVVRHGWLVYEKYFGRADRNANPDMASCGKAFTSIALGIALKEKHDLIPQGLDTKVFTDRYLPEAFPLDDPAKAEITLGQLLSMSAGFHGEGTQPGYKNGVRIPLERYQQERTEHGHDGHPHAAVVQARRRLFVLVALAAYRLDRAPQAGRHGARRLPAREARRSRCNGSRGLTA